MIVIGIVICAGCVFIYGVYMVLVNAGVGIYLAWPQARKTAIVPPANCGHQF